MDECPPGGIYQGLNITHYSMATQTYEIHIYPFTKFDFSSLTQ